ncbi:MAG: OsmC family protein [Hyphomicrobiaceae bacterium]|nr:OsmC family protein [Hyphomicrobiaceae bacterium]
MDDIKRISFTGADGVSELSARLDLPAGRPRAYAIFAHCFTCSKDLNAARRIAGTLAGQGIGVLRFDFTGLGSSEGEFASTNFSSNVADLVAAANFLEANYEAPQLLIGHSLGGAAVLVAAGRIGTVRAVATIGAPADAEHVVKNFDAHLEDIAKCGEADVALAGRRFTIRQQFIEDLQQASVRENLKHMRKALLVLHSPTDNVVGVSNAAEIFEAARHPKSFVSLDGADHLLTREGDAIFAASMIGAWAERYLDPRHKDVDEHAPTAAVLRETHNGKFQNSVRVNQHRLLADEPVRAGGLDSGPSPYDFLAIALGACTSMTLRIYADFKGLDVGTIDVMVDHAKVYADDKGEEGAKAKIDRFERRIGFSRDLDSETRAKLLKIADKCPVHKTLKSSSEIVTDLV